MLVSGTSAGTCQSLVPSEEIRKQTLNDRCLRSNTNGSQQSYHISSPTCKSWLTSSHRHQSAHTAARLRAGLSAIFFCSRIRKNPGIIQETIKVSRIRLHTFLSHAECSFDLVVYGNPAFATSNRTHVPESVAACSFSYAIASETKLRLNSNERPRNVRCSGSQRFHRAIRQHTQETGTDDERRSDQHHSGRRFAEQ